MKKFAICSTTPPMNAASAACRNTNNKDKKKKPSPCSETMSVVSIDPISDTIREAAWQITGDATDFDPLLDMIGDAPFVLLGEASHGTHEFYAIRAELTKRLIAEKNFVAVAVEADWPDSYRVN